MEITDELLVKNEIKKRIEKHIAQFPIYFYGNIIINIFLILLFITTILLLSVSIRFYLQGIQFIFISMVIIASIFRATSKDFLKNLHSLKEIEADRYGFGIEDYEMDNALELLKKLPMTKKDLKQMEISLSYKKVIQVLEDIHIIAYRKKLWDADIAFRYNLEKHKENIATSD